MDNLAHSFKAPEGKYFLQYERNYGSVPFNYSRSTKLSLAVLPGNQAEDGTWIIYNSGDHVYISRYDSNTSAKKEASRALLFPNSASKPAFPTCHAYTTSKDGPDLLVGLFDGSVELISLRTQLRMSPSTTKPNTAAKVFPEPEQEGAHCTAVAWIPKSDASHFAVACASGCIYIYKKSVVIGEGGSKFLGLGASTKNVSPTSTFTACSGCYINDIAFSPDGTRLAVACKDGILRILDASTGALVAGMQSFYGAMLCCSFSADSKYVAAGGEDDMVAVYGMQEKCPIAHLEGHRSWVSSVRFDPWVQLATEGMEGGTILRIVSVGQDAQMCLWEIQTPSSEGGFLPSVPSSMGMRKVTSQASLAGAGWQGSDQAPPTPGRQAAAAAKSNGSSSCICPAPPRVEMVLYEPLMEHKLHQEPISDVLVSEQMIYTADFTGCVKTWLRPGVKGSNTGYARKE